MPQDEKLLEQIRKRFDYVVKSWSDIRDEARTDVRFASGDPWPEEERKARKAAGRLCLSLDEINQYINQKVNDVRMNKRAITVHPARNGADEKTAEFRQALMRQIEYESNAQAAYATGFENVLIRSYGAWRVGTRYCGDDEEAGADQEIVIRRIPNPDTVFMDPDAKEADFSDGDDVTVIDRMTSDKFLDKWPWAEVRSFTPEMMAYAPSWIQMDGDTCHVQVAEYWKVKTTKRRQLLKNDGRKFYLDEIKGGRLDGGVAVGPDGQPIMDIANHRPISKRTVHHERTRDFRGEPVAGEIHTNRLPCWARDVRRRRRRLQANAVLAGTAGARPHLALLLYPHGGIRACGYVAQDAVCRSGRPV